MPTAPRPRWCSRSIARRRLGSNNTSSRWIASCGAAHRPKSKSDRRRRRDWSCLRRFLGPGGKAEARPPKVESQKPQRVADIRVRGETDSGPGGIKLPAAARRSAGFPACRFADFLVGRAWQWPDPPHFSTPAGGQTGATADSELVSRELGFFQAEELG